MEIPVLQRQVAEKVDICEIPLLRQYDIPPEVETTSSPKPDELELDDGYYVTKTKTYLKDYVMKTVNRVEYIAYKGALVCFRSNGRII
jgi:hypothetical protein